MKNDWPIKKRLKEARLRKGLSQKALGILIGIDEFTASARMNQYETGKHTPDYSTLKKIAAVLEVPTAYFYTEDDDLAALLNQYYIMKPAVRKRLLEYINQLLSE